MRRMTVLLSLALLCGLLSSCGKGGSPASSGAHATAAGPRTTTIGPATGGPSTGGPSTGGAASSTQRALAFVRTVNLTAADVPGFKPNEKHAGDSAREKRLERQMLRCTGLTRSDRAIAEQGSKDFQLKRSIIDLSVSSEVSVQRSAADADGALAAIRSAHVRGCFSHYLELLFRGQRVNGATLGGVTIQSGTPPAPGMSGSFGWRVTATFDLRHVKVPIYLDILGFIQGPAEVTLTSSGLLRPFPAEVQQHLFALLLSRAKAHRL